MQQVLQHSPGCSTLSGSDRSGVRQTCRTRRLQVQAATGRKQETEQVVYQQKPNGSEIKPIEVGADGQKVGFRWDPTLQRWVRDKRVSSDSWGNVTMKPKTGGEYLIWPAVWSYLSDKNLKSVDLDQAQALAAKGATYLDVRTSGEYEREHVAGAVSLPLFQDVSGDSFWDNTKRFVMATAFAMRATERSPTFGKDALELLDKSKPVIVYCGIGGTIEVGVKPWAPGRRSYDDPDRAFGRESRSLKACYELFQAGFTNVVHLKGGFSQWRYSKYPTEN